MATRQLQSIWNDEHIGGLVDPGKTATVHLDADNTKNIMLTMTARTHITG